MGKDNDCEIVQMVDVQITDVRMRRCEKHYAHRWLTMRIFEL